jgi:hypothetical protein
MEPKYCSKCGKELINLTLDPEYDMFTGQKLENNQYILSCPTLLYFHDKWDVFKGDVKEWNYLDSYYDYIGRKDNGVRYAKR